MDGQGLPLPGPHRGDPRHQPKDRASPRHHVYHQSAAPTMSSASTFDYLRDNATAIYATEMVQRGHAFAIVDEVDPSSSTRPAPPHYLGQGQVHPALHRSGRLCGSGPAGGQRGHQGGQPRSGRRLRGGREGPHRHPHRPGHRQAEQQFQVAQPVDPENTTLSHHINQAIGPGA